MKHTKLISSIVLIVILFSSILNGVTDFELYQYAKKNYIAAIFKNDKKKELEYLKEIIFYGKKSDQDIRKYQIALHRTSFNSNIKQEPKKNSQSSLKQSPIDLSLKNIEILKNKATKDIQKSIYVANNSLVIDFEDKIDKNDIKFTRSKNNNEGYNYKIEINGNINDFDPSSNISVDGVRLTEIVQKSDKLFSINMTVNQDSKVYYAINENRLIIKIKSEDNEKILNNSSSDNLIKNDDDKYIIKDIVKKTRIIVIDAGHGGKDPGAVGPNNEHEKDVVLSTAHYLSNILKRLGYVVYLTRDDDTFIELKDRTKIANTRHADLFVSIHANAAPQFRAMDAKGIETYFLSPARSEKAKRVAALENKEDIDAIDSYASKDILLTLLNKEKTLASQKLAIDIQSNMLYKLRKTFSNGSIIDNGVREAPFWVLVGAQMPAVLVEMGYISHPEESQRLINSQYQQEIANGIAEGITAYFIHNR